MKPLYGKLLEIPDSDDEDVDKQLVAALKMSCEQPTSNSPTQPTSAEDSGVATRGKGVASICVTASAEQTTIGNRKKRKVVSLLTDDEGESDEDVVEILKSSKSVKNTNLLGMDSDKTSNIQSPNNKRQCQELKQPEKPEGSAVIGSGFSGIDRAQMERERLERAKVRPAVQDTAKPTEIPRDSSKCNNENLRYKDRWRAVKTKPSDSLPNSDSTKSQKFPAFPTLKSNKEPVLKYPKGTVKKTWSMSQEREADDIMIEEVLQKETLRTTLLSAFQWDYEWIMSKLPLSKKNHNMVFVLHGKDPEDVHNKEMLLGGLPRLELVFPNMEGQIMTMHSKLMLLFHKRSEEEWLRIAVPSANLTDYDWGECGGIMENMVFIIDLPKMQAPNPKQTFFLEELLHFCQAQDIPNSIINALVYYDFAETQGMAFVHTIGGSHGGNLWKRTGVCGLGRAIKKLGYNTGKGLEVDFVTSSLGAVKMELVANMYRAAQGHTGIKELKRRQRKPIAKPSANRNGTTADADETTDDEESDIEEETNLDVIKSNLRVYFPSRETVRDSIGGPGSGGTVCLQRKWWNDQSFPKAIVKDCKSVRPRMLMHNKLLFARPAQVLDSRNGQVAAWAYVGTANFSESAWGKLVMDRGSKSPKIGCRNWECGVIVPVHTTRMGQTLSGAPVKLDGPPGIDIFNGVVPVPMETPGQPLVNPWFYTEPI